MSRYLECAGGGGAKARKYDMTGTGLMVLTGVLAMWFAALFFKFG